MCKLNVKKKTIRTPANIYNKHIQLVFKPLTKIHPQTHTNSETEKKTTGKD